jgi:hypothetical protein
LPAPKFAASILFVPVDQPEIKPMSRPASAVTRRGLVTAAGTVGALVAAVPLLPRIAAPDAAPVAQASPPARGGGYRVTDHIRQYYRTTRT